MKILVLSLFVSLFMAVGPAWPAQTVTLSEIIKRGTGTSLEIQKAQSEKAAAQAEYRLARSKLFPTLDMNASAGTTMASENYGHDFADVYKARLDLEQPLYTGGVISAGLKAANFKKDMAENRFKSARQDYVFNVVDAYYKAAQGQVLLTIAKENRTILKNYFDITSRYAAIGRSKAVDKLQAEASYHLSESQVLEAESNLESVKQNLIRLLGEDFDIEAQLDPKLNLRSYDPGPLEKLLQQALEENPSIRATELELESLIQLNKAKMIDHRPRLSIKGSWGYDAPNEYDWIKEKGEAYSLMLNLKIPLFSGFGSFAQSDQYHEQRVQLEKDLAIKRRELRKTLSSSVATLQRDFQRLRLTQASAASSKKAMDVAVTGYRNGLLSASDVLTIQRNRFDADRQYSSTQFSYNLQILSLRRDLGVDLEKAYEN